MFRVGHPHGDLVMLAKIHDVDESWAKNEIPTIVMGALASYPSWMASEPHQLQFAATVIGVFMVKRV
jgi:hypothetical protein